MDRARQDLRHALRALARVPGLSVVVVLSLALAIGVNTAVFSWIDYLVLAPVPGVDVGDLHLVEPRTEARGYPGTSWPEFADLRRRLRGLEGLAAWRMAPVSVGEPGRAERMFAQLVSDSFFSTLRLPLAIGRDLRAEDAARPGGAPVAIVSHDYWQTRLGGAMDAVGRTVRVNGLGLTVVGVTPAGFQGTVVGLNFDLWVPATLAPTLFAGSRDLDDRRERGYTVFGRLATGTTTAQVETELLAAMADLARAYPETNLGMQGEVIPFWKTPRGPQRMLAQGLVALQSLLLLLLAAVCANLASLMLARSADRQREVGVRLAMGAGRASVVLALLWEPLLLAAAGTAAGVVLAVWGTEALRAMPLPGNMPFRFQTAVDPTGLAFAGALGLASAVLFGGLPAWQLARLDPQQALRGVRLAGTGRLRRGLMGAQVALALVVLVAGGLIVRGLADGRQHDPGFRRTGLLLAAYDLTGRPVEPADFTRRVLHRLRTTAGVDGAAVASSVPLDIHGLPPRAFTVDGRVRSDGGTDRVLTNVVTPGYFDVMGIAVLEGRDFVPLEDPSAPPEAIVNQAFVDRFLGPAEPLGRRLESGGRAHRIVGVVRTTISDAFGEAPAPALYFSYRDRRASVGEVHLRVAPGSEPAAVLAIRTALEALDPSLPVYNVRTMADHIERNLVFRRVPARMMAVLAPLLLALAAMGIYGVVAHVVAQRTAEIGVRLALGATGPQVVREVVLDTMRVAAVGATAGLALAVVLVVDVLGGGVRDVPLLAGVPVLLLGVAAVACWLPARHAAAVDPVRALRHD